MTKNKKIQQFFLLRGNKDAWEYSHRMTVFSPAGKSCCKNYQVHCKNGLKGELSWFYLATDKKGRDISFFKTGYQIQKRWVFLERERGHKFSGKLLRSRLFHMPRQWNNDVISLRNGINDEVKKLWGWFLWQITLTVRWTSINLACNCKLAQENILPSG